MNRAPKLHRRKRPAKKHVVDTTPGYKKWYDLAIWRKRLRPAVLLRDLWICQKCDADWGHDTSQLVADHIKDHKGVWALFIDMTNLTTLCKKCHDRKKKPR